MTSLHYFLIGLAVAITANFNPPIAFAAPTMFVKENREGAWEADLTLVPNAKEDAGISVDAINAFIKQRLSARAVASPLDSFTPICLMNFARIQDVVSSDRKTQIEIRNDLEEYPRSFAEDFISGNEMFLLRVGIFEFCSDPDPLSPTPTPFMTLLITDQSGNIREFDALIWEFIRIFKRSDGRVSLLGCFACGEVQELRYNPKDREFYYKWIGH